MLTSEVRWHQQARQQCRSDGFNNQCRPEVLRMYSVLEIKSTYVGGSTSLQAVVRSVPIGI